MVRVPATLGLPSEAGSPTVAEHQSSPQTRGRSSPFFSRQLSLEATVLPEGGGHGSGLREGSTVGPVAV